MPGFGKSGMFRTAAETSSAVTILRTVQYWWHRALVTSENRALLLNRFEFLNHFAQFGERNILDLAHAFASDAELLADLFESFFRSTVQTKTITEDGRLARVESFDHLLEHAGDGFVLQLLVRREGVFVLDDFGEVVRFVVTDRSIERSRSDRGGAQLRDAGGGDAQLLTQLIIGWFTPELFLQTHRGATHLRDFVDEVDG